MTTFTQESLAAILAIEDEPDLSVDEIFERNVYPEKKISSPRDYVYTKKEIIRRLLAICHRMYRDKFHYEELGSCWVKLNGTRHRIKDSLIAEDDKDRMVLDSMIRELHDFTNCVMIEKGKKDYFEVLQHTLQEKIEILLAILATC